MQNDWEIIVGYQVAATINATILTLYSQATMSSILARYIMLNQGTLAYDMNIKQSICDGVITIEYISSCNNLVCSFS